MHLLPLSEPDATGAVLLGFFGHLFTFPSRWFYIFYFNIIFSFNTSCTSRSFLSRVMVLYLSHAHGIWILGLADITVGVWQDLSHKKEYTIGLGRGIWINQGGTHPWNGTRAGTLHTIPRKWWWLMGEPSIVLINLTHK